MFRLNDEPSGAEAEARTAPDLHARVETVFGASGLLGSGLGLEERSGQTAMARAVAEALEGRHTVLFEAGTGVGKSLAYLIPSLLHAQGTGHPVVVSTHTIALQEQILHKDLELCRHLARGADSLGLPPDFKVALLLGKGNYLCGTRLKQALASRTELFPSRQQKELERIVAWSGTAQRGLVQELSPPPDPEVWEWVNADSPACNSRNCTPATCPYRRARQELRDAQLIIVNHSLLFALLGAGMQPPAQTPGILFPHDSLILDEAHTVPEVATEHFGAQLSSFGLRRALLRLHNPSGRKGHGLLARLGARHELDAVERARHSSDLFFESVGETLLAQQALVRVRAEAWAEDPLSEPLKELVKVLGDRWSRLEDGPMRDELDGLRQLLNSYRLSLEDCLQLGQDDHVYWVEKTGRKTPIIHLRSAPLDVAKVLNRHLFTRDTGVVLTSATLAEGPSLESFQNRVGAWGAAAHQAGSPFDYARQMRILLAADAPAPGADSGALDREYLADMIRFCCLQVPGGSLVLFTSYADMQAVARTVAPAVEKAGRLFLMQGQQGSRTELTRQLQAAGNGVLFGTESFWTGVDVPGPALSQVIITRLPFRNPTHPIEEARAEDCRARGGNPFAELTLPAALVRFRQGLGRLIRSRSDMGWLTVLDSRILHKEYGRQFLAVLPHRGYQRLTRANRERFFV